MLEPPTTPERTWTRWCLLVVVVVRLVVVLAVLALLGCDPLKASSVACDGPSLPLPEEAKAMQSLE